MNLDDDPAQAEFRERVRAFLGEHRSRAPHGEDVAQRRAWQQVLADGGLACVSWPAEFGGLGLGPVEEVIVAQELQRAGLPGVLDFIGLGMLGPALIAHGSAEQQHRYLGPMLRGDEVWCQLFSEPGAGSDLAAVQCRARSDADGGWLVNGQKVWTTNAQFASFGMLLGRTDPAVPKHRGLTMFIVPMDAAGVTVRPLRQISGEAHFNEVFLDDVRLGADAVVDAVGGGWRVALTVLMFERLAVGNQAEDFGVNAEALAAAIAGAHRDADVRARLGEVASELLALRFGSYRTMTELQAGRTPGPEAGLGKITLVRAAAEAAELACDVLGPAALVPGSPWSQMTSMVPGLKSAGGTEQILRSTIGERVLGLPPEPRLDKDVPFAELTRAR